MNDEFNQQNFSDWVDMEQLIDYTEIINKNIHILEKYNHLDKNLFIKIINKMVNGFDSISKTNGYCLFFADINKIDNLWKKSKNYISDDFSQIKNQLSQLKYLDARKDLFNLNINMSPILIINDNLEFLNRSHYFANLRDLGQKYIPVISYVDCSKNFHKIIYQGW